MYNNWIWGLNGWRDKSLFVKHNIVAGHEKKQLILRLSGLYIGFRHKRAIFNSEFLLLNYIKKSNFIKKLVTTRSEFFFMTSRYEFSSLVKNWAAAAGCQFVFFKNPGDLNDLESSFVVTKSKSPVIVLFNNDKNFTSGAVNEILTKKYFSISIADSNSLYTDKYFIPIYGNDDSAVALNFFGKFLSAIIKKNFLLKKKEEVISPKGGGRGDYNSIYDFNRPVMWKWRKQEKILQGQQKKNDISSKFDSI